MIKSLLGIAPQQEADGSFKPSKVALMLSTSKVSNFKNTSTAQYDGNRSKVLVLFTEEKNMTMENGRKFSTGNHPVEALLPLLHLRNAGFEFEVTTPSGKPVVFEMWAFPEEDQAVVGIFKELKSDFESPIPLQEAVLRFTENSDMYAAIFVPGGHGVMLGIPQDPIVGTLLRSAHEKGIYTISLCHGPGAFLATTLEGHEFLYDGYEMAVFPDSVDKMTPMIGYLPGPMPWRVEEKLSAMGAKIANKKADKTCCIDRKLITGASPLAANDLGKLVVAKLLEQLA